jgi:hypothetical protein
MLFSVPQGTIFTIFTFISQRYPLHWSHRSAESGWLVSALGHHLGKAESDDPMGLADNEASGKVKD